MKHTFPGATRALIAPLGLLTAAVLSVPPAAAQSASRLPVTPAQRATAQQVAAQGVPLSALAPDAPDQYTVRRGDTLWRISSLFLKSPWRWPELWGMNLQDIRNPHLIYPGQQLYLERLGDRAFLRARRGADGEVGDTVRVSPRNRIEMLGTGPLPTLEPHLIEPFLTEPLVVDDDSFQRAPRIVALANQSRVLVAKGDRAYVRGPADAPLLKQAGDPTEFRVFRNAKPLKDPVTDETLGYEGHYVGQATLVRGESEAEEDAGAAPAVRPTRWPANGEVQTEPRRAAAPQPRALPVPATVDVISSKEEMRAGDRLLPEPPREYRNYVPRVPEVPVDARVVAVPGSAVRYAGQNQVVVINKGLQDGIESGHVLALLSTGPKLVDKTDEARGLMKLPDERNGIAMVFRPFERVSYVLVMEITNPVQVGDKLVNPN
ncbi:MAG: LysM peptidoglycan-binding domain-containing protein [Rubrivivax sp.]|nr:LysM peptidoglycan-binding domain-containing protein [Rubrivivax sp.]MCZ2089013.1 LysM peptidoglycan-binding domain-containing protein [Burkholderiales bacterium]TXI15722.1 MAG: LysM peptidoglycan-binding domain-containing protein [Ottowia sp.]HQO53599.1 LysM peptidoglycan-binding domain-containing protein [Ottowia sp.]